MFKYTIYVENYSDPISITAACYWEGYADGVLYFFNRVMNEEQVDNFSKGRGFEDTLVARFNVGKVIGFEQKPTEKSL